MFAATKTLVSDVLTVDEEFIRAIELVGVAVGAGQHLPDHRIFGNDLIANAIGLGQNTPIEEDRCVVT